MIGRFGRTVLRRSKGGLSLLLLSAIVAAPGISAAKTVQPGPGPMPEGDPTSDDQPSPTPKKAARFIGGTSTVRESNGMTRIAPAGRMTWELYLRILSRLVLR
jgi:hypothetical protein